MNGEYKAGDFLGNTYTDKVTKFKGVCTGYAEYLTGCAQILLAAPATKDGTVNSLWVDIPRCEADTKAKVVSLEVPAGRNGPDISPPRNI